jgi:hypothetical protein
MRMLLRLWSSREAEACGRKQRPSDPFLLEALTLTSGFPAGSILPRETTMSNLSPRRFTKGSLEPDASNPS